MAPVVEKPWFGPRKLPGWGWSPVTWQGWAVMLGFFVAILLCGFLLPGIAFKLIAVLVLVVLLLAVCLLTGTRPSGHL